MKRGVEEGGTPSFANTMIGVDTDMGGMAAAPEAAAAAVVVGCIAAAVV